MDVLFYETFDEEARLLRELLPSTIKAGFTSNTIQANADHVLPAELISIRTQSLLPASWYSGLKGVLARTAGYDHLLRYRTQGGDHISWGYLVNYCSRAVAEQAVMFMLALLRKFPRQMEQFDVFRRDGLTGAECLGKNCLVVGVGNIGSEVIQLARAMGMSTKGVDIVQRHKDVDYVDLEKGLCWAQVIVCALPLTSETRGLLNYERLRRVVKKPIVINISRGEITPLEDMARLIKENLIRGLGIDVLPEEDVVAEYMRALGDDHPLVQTVFHLKSLDNVIFTPHNAFNTHEALLDKCHQTVKAVELFLKEKKFPNEVTG